MKKNEQINMADVENTLKNCLKRVPFLEIESFQKAMIFGEISVDSVAVVRIGDKRQRLLIEAKNNGQPRFARMAALEIARVLEDETDAYGVFMAPYISPRAAEICLKAKIGYLDFAGNCRMTFGQVYIEHESKPNPFARKRDLRSLYSSKAARVLRVLLTDPKKPWRVQALADAADVSLGQVSNVKSLLEDREWLNRSDVGMWLKDPESVLFEWSKNCNSGKSESRNYYSLKSIPEMEADLAKTCEGEGIAYALTGFSGAARYAPSVRYQRVMAYVSGDMERIAEILSLKEVTSGANVTLFTHFDEGVLYGMRQIDGICIASPVQVYLDLLGVKGRGEEAAKAILDEVIKRSW